MESLRMYGKVIREYQGKGFITLYNGQTCDCMLQTVQLADGKLIANCLFDENLNLVRKCLDRDDSIKSITGISNKDEELSLQGQMQYTDFNDRMTLNGNTISLTVFAGSLTANKKPSSTPISVKFGITNLEFFGNKFREYPNGGEANDTLSVNLDDKTIEIHEVDDYRSTIKSIKAQSSIDVTSEAEIEVCSEDDLNTAIQLVGTLCKLLSFARGTKINWIYYDCYNDNGEITSSFHKNNVTWHYTGEPVIAYSNPYDTPNFVEQTYTSYLGQKDIHGLDIAIEAYLDAKRGSTYLETRALRAVVVLEFLKSRYATEKGIQFILKSSPFKKVSHKVKRTLEEHFTEKSSPEDTLREVNSKIGELNRRSLKTILEIMFADLGITITKEKLDRFVNIRNSLVHKGFFLTKESWQEYAFVINILDRIFLRILDYTGFYLDITDKFRRIESKAPSVK